MTAFGLRSTLALFSGKPTLRPQYDSYSAFKAIGDLVVTGPTLTNVNDIRAILIG
ncbi:MOFRL family protein [Ensifer adhaerens]|nr:MOFRL family protein [Ensifer adhaerens]